MILDRLDLWKRYASHHPLFAEAFAYLRQPGLVAMPPGRHEVIGARLYASIEQRDGRGKEGARLEAHRRYIDIQCTLSGVDVMGWRAAKDCHEVSDAYDEARDVMFFRDRPDTWLVVPAGHFAVFFPDDVHAPLAGDGPLHKVVMKIEV